jgi:hypothetical protein
MILFFSLFLYSLWFCMFSCVGSLIFFWCSSCCFFIFILIVGLHQGFLGGFGFVSNCSIVCCIICCRVLN